MVILAMIQKITTRTYALVLLYAGLQYFMLFLQRILKLIVLLLK